ncbi:hypothetical protein [Mycobacterium xenopi]|uniref:Uncharacterized protein n=1 Tax=Mycobacterium xenopi TaxID=1789 RepID=A0AAD1H3W8_MYCXE|nr:hypothetical protein [Mycobacterium xenopi]MDA3638934.1 hypothetical protein [Mycobacterium xenopi]MDA3657240.1 hypothetical protein [Mycobacterium xenopi]MDA3664306.1 hypothetical protein [Mycobacterium xenopi]ORX21956.1 hypothetical protein AWC32_21070 [Mycobacterium xenopi]SPX89999.1 Uncharacterised protein [Mycobacterium xenopi]
MGKEKKRPRQVRRLDPLGRDTGSAAPAKRDGGTLEASFVTHQDSVLPVKLNFPPPLAHLGSELSTFDYQWQLLTYAFNLPDPADFPALPGQIPDKELRRLTRFIDVCEKTAKYTVVAHKGGITLKGEHGNWELEVNETEDEETVGFAVRFRQLHENSTGEPDFSSVMNILEKYARQFTDEHTDTRTDMLQQWRKARAKLMNRPLQNIVCRMVLQKDGLTPDQIDEHAMYNEANPAEIINFFNYGELIHYGKHSEEYDKLAEDAELEAIQHNNFKQAMLGLIHLYFGFSEVIRSAIGLKRAQAA